MSLLKLLQLYGKRGFSTNNQKVLNLSNTCKERLKEICTDNCFLRITVEGGGCSGFQYKFDLDSEKAPDDLVFGEHSAQVVVDSISLDYISGSTIDFHKELIRSGFRIVNNPKVDQGCSCGASFSVKLD